MRDAEVASLIKMGPEALPAIHALQADWWFRSRSLRACMETLVGIGGPGVAKEAAFTLARHSRDQRRLPLFALGALAFLASLNVLVFPFEHNSVFAFWPGLAIGMAVAVWLSIRMRREALQLAATLKESSLCGVLASCYAERGMRDLAEAPLRRLLPDVTEDDATQWDARQRAAVIRLLGHHDERLIIGALHAVALFGAEDAVEPIDHLAKHGPPWMRESIGQTLAAVRRRIEQQKDRETLLRASTALDASPETLLRPAAALADPAPEQLLRPSETSRE